MKKLTWVAYNWSWVTGLVIPFCILLYVFDILYSKKLEKKLPLSLWGFVRNPWEKFWI